VYGFEGHIAANKTKTIFIMVVFIAAVIALGYFAGFLVDPALADIVLFGSVVLAVFSTGTSYWYADRIITGMVDARPANPQVYIEKYYIDTVEGLVLACGLPYIPKAYVIESDALNAFATGRDPEHSLIGVTTGLLQTLDRQELEGVIAHEMAHIYNRDTLLMMVAAILVGGVAMFSHSIMRILYYGGGGGGRDRDSRDSGGGAGGILIIVALVFMILAPIFANLLNLFLSRKREFLADATAVSLTRNPDGLINALRKITAHHQPMPFVEKELSALFIENPHEAADAESGIATLFSTHPPVGQRIRALETM
jgi:heat shock protein HtpX